MTRTIKHLLKLAFKKREKVTGPDMADLIDLKDLLDRETTYKPGSNSIRAVIEQKNGRKGKKERKGKNTRKEMKGRKRKRDGPAVEEKDGTAVEKNELAVEKKDDPAVEKKNDPAVEKAKLGVDGPEGWQNFVVQVNDSRLQKTVISDEDRNMIVQSPLTRFEISHLEGYKASLYRQYVLPRETAPRAVVRVRATDEILKTSFEVDVVIDSGNQNTTLAIPKDFRTGLFGIHTQKHRFIKPFNNNAYLLKLELVNREVPTGSGQRLAIPASWNLEPMHAVVIEATTPELSVLGWEAVRFWNLGVDPTRSLAKVAQTKESEAQESKAKESKAKESKAKESKAKESKAKEPEAKESVAAGKDG
ncbi:hypothetical protein EJ06DRAFT_549587 [Trichodelitschia bisporula]|uniref:Uncharacterized protein n=1 Tax=Trichodelitschia bisporula TaxID=703511 RepID=A0A6G1HTX1_9PEZI|nr:hypothetical protein EJ06DRAFT_549587 [Trichodelitschia bisporula]